MPQMSPMPWVLVMVFSLFFLVFVSSFIYFCIPLKKTQSLLKFEALYFMKW